MVLNFRLGAVPKWLLIKKQVSEFRGLGWVGLVSVFNRLVPVLRGWCQCSRRKNWLKADVSAEGVSGTNGGKRLMSVLNGLVTKK